MVKKVLLIRPYFREVLNQQTFPLGLGYLAASLRKNKYSVQIVDLPILNITNEEFIRYTKNWKLDYIGITALTTYYEGMKELCRLIKKSPEFSNIPIIVGGIHVSSLPEFFLKDTGADIVVIGEGERTIVELLQTLDEKKSLYSVRGIGFFENDLFIQTEARDLIKNLDEIPPPAWDLINPDLYPANPHGFFYKKTPIFPILSSRGCPFNCIYCASKSFWRQRIRFHSVKRIVDEIEFLVKKYGAKEIHIWDDNFTLNRKFVFNFCREIYRRHLKLYFACPNGVKIDTLDPLLLRIMRSVGFYSLIFAVESGSQKILHNIGKDLDLQKVPCIIATAKKLHYFTRGFFIYGLPTETIQNVYETINFAIQLKLDYANFFIFSPLPGSPFFYNWIKGKDLSSINWNFNYFSNAQDMRGFNKIPQKDILKIQKFLYIKFILFRPLRIVNYFLQIRLKQYSLFIKRIRFMLKNKA